MRTRALRQRKALFFCGVKLKFCDGRNPRRSACARNGGGSPARAGCHHRSGTGPLGPIVCVRGSGRSGGGGVVCMGGGSDAARWPLGMDDGEPDGEPVPWIAELQSNVWNEYVIRIVVTPGFGIIAIDCFGSVDFPAVATSDGGTDWSTRGKLLVLPFGRLLLVSGVSQLCRIREKAIDVHGLGTRGYLRWFILNICAVAPRDRQDYRICLIRLEPTH